MKKIKRTITVRKVEFISNRKHDHESKTEICPLCKSPIHAITPANSSAVEYSAAELPTILSGQAEIEILGENDEKQT